MKQSLFESRHKAEWERFALALERLERGKETSQVAGFPKAYRHLCQHLALAQERGYSSFLIDSLQQRLVQARQERDRGQFRHGPARRPLPDPVGGGRSAERFPQPR